MAVIKGSVGTYTRPMVTYSLKCLDGSKTCVSNETAYPVTQYSQCGDMDIQNTFFSGINSGQFPVIYGNEYIINRESMHDLRLWFEMCAIDDYRTLYVAIIWLIIFSVVLSAYLTITCNLASRKVQTDTSMSSVTKYLLLLHPLLPEIFLHLKNTPLSSIIFAIYFAFGLVLQFSLLYSNTEEVCAQLVTFAGLFDIIYKLWWIIAASRKPSIDLNNYKIGVIEFAFYCSTFALNIAAFVYVCKVSRTKTDNSSFSSFSITLRLCSLLLCSYDMYKVRPFSKKESLSLFVSNATILPVEVNVEQEPSIELK
jgi:hypothetical protein